MDFSTAAILFCSTVSASESSADDAEDEVAFLGGPLCSPRSGRGEEGFCQSDVVLGMRIACFVESKGLVKKRSRGYEFGVRVGVCEREPYMKVW